MIHRLVLILAGLFLAGSIVVALDRGLSAIHHARLTVGDLADKVTILEERLTAPGSLPLRPAHLQQLRDAIKGHRQRARAYRKELFPTAGSASRYLTAPGAPYERFRGDRTGLYLELGNDAVLAALANGISDQLAGLQLRSREAFAGLPLQDQEKALFELMLVRRVIEALGGASVTDLRRLRFGPRPVVGPYGPEVELVGLDVAFVAAPEDVRKVLRALLASGWSLPVCDVGQIRVRRLTEDDWGLHTTRYTAPPVEARFRLRMLIIAGGG